MTPRSLLFVVLLLVFVLAACGAQQGRQAHRVLDGVTDAADPTYQLAVDTCDAARDAIVAREGTTYEEDRDAMDQVAELCDPMIAGFESLRSLQMTARVAIDSGEVTTTAAAAVSEALQLWGKLRELVPQLEQLGR